jgi:type III pantothenate kinase
MILDLDHGNTRLKWRLLDNASVVVDRGVLIARQEGALRSLSAVLSVADRVRLSSVHSPEREKEIERMCKEYSVDFFLAKTVNQCCGVINGYTNPQAMGVDRWLAMIAAYNMRKTASCIIDCGSAITVDFVDLRGVHLGGYIVPGLQLSRGSLQADTKRVLFSASEPFDSCDPGSNTQDAVSHGVLDMASSWINTLCGKAKVQLGSQTGLFMTGGDAPLIIEHLDYQVEYYPDLVMDGLVYAEQEGRSVFEHN